MDLKKLGEPTPKNAVKTKPGKGGSGPISYIDARHVYDRLDDAVGAGNWQTSLERMDNGWLAGIAIKVDGEWVWKHDYGDDSNWDPIKGGASDALKRAAVQWGIGRDLYGEDKPEDPKPGIWDPKQMKAASDVLPPDTDAEKMLNYANRKAGLPIGAKPAEITKFFKLFVGKIDEGLDKNEAFLYAKDNWK